MEKLLLPSSVTITEGEKPNIGRVIITPCYHGYGTTLGNALRRVLLSSLPGAAVKAVKIKGVQHEFSTIDGVKEDVVDIVLNLKLLRLRVFSDEPVKIQLSAKGQGPVTASQIDATSDVEIINGDLVLATITDEKAALEMEITVGQGRGYVSSEEQEGQTLELGTIAVDSIYTPVTEVGYSVEFTRVGYVTNYEKLTLDIETDGTMTPGDALTQAVEILMDHLRIIESGAHEETEAPGEDALNAEYEPAEEAAEDGGRTHIEAYNGGAEAEESGHENSDE